MTSIGHRDVYNGSPNRSSSGNSYNNSTEIELQVLQSSVRNRSVDPFSFFVSMKMNRTQLVLVQLLCIVMYRVVEAQLIRVESFQAPSSDGIPNTFIGTGRQIASSLLDAATPALMYGVVSSAHVIVICQQIVNTGHLSFDADVVTSLESSTIQVLTFQITATEGCTEAVDASGIEAVMVDNSGRQSTLVCPSTNSATTGCAIYLTGDDVSNLYNQGSRRRLLARRVLLHKKCNGEAKKGAISGVITGILSIAACATFTGPLAPFCAAGMLGASAGLGAAANCAASCFPGDATVTMANGGTKQMAALALGDKVAVRKRNGGLEYEDIYAFGHKDEFASGTFLQLTLKPINENMIDPIIKSRSFELTPLHFVPIFSGKLKFKRAQDILKGEKMWAHEGSQIPSLHIVTNISWITKKGLYNPFTICGTIIVNGVVASTHSDWFLDGIFEFFNLVHYLPIAYQLVLLPVRMMYHGLGQKAYIFLYERLDSLVEISEHGGSIIASISIVATLLMIKVIGKSTRFLGLTPYFRTSAP